MIAILRFLAPIKKWLFMALGGAILLFVFWFFVTEYIERGIRLKSIEITKEQNKKFQEQVEELVKQRQQDEQEIEESVEKVEEPDDVADPWLVDYVKQLL